MDYSLKTDAKKWRSSAVNAAFLGCEIYFSLDFTHWLRGSDRGQTPFVRYFIDKRSAMSTRHLWGQTPWPPGGLLEKRAEVLRRVGGDGLAGEILERAVEGFREVQFPRVEEL